MQKALYGLRQAPRAWYTKINIYLQNQGLTQGGANANVYFFNEGGKIMPLTLYFDDVYLTCIHIPKLDWIQSEIKYCFEMIDLGLLRHSLGLEHFFHPNGIMITQHGYAHQMFIDFGYV